MGPADLSRKRGDLEGERGRFTFEGNVEMNGQGGSDTRKSYYTLAVHTTLNRHPIPCRGDRGQHRKTKKVERGHVIHELASGEI